MDNKYNTVDVNYLIDESIKEVQRATNYILKEAATHYTSQYNTPYNHTVYKVNLQEVKDLANRGN